MYYPNWGQTGEGRDIRCPDWALNRLKLHVYTTQKCSVTIGVEWSFGALHHATLKYSPEITEIDLRYVCSYSFATRYPQGRDRHKNAPGTYDFRGIH